MSPKEREEEIRKIPLTEEEKAEAYYEWQKRKFFKERNKEYWHEQEKNLPSDYSSR